MKNDTIIVGPGPSLRDSGMGDVIDSYGTIIRFPTHPSHLMPAKDVGRRATWIVVYAAHVMIPNETYELEKGYLVHHKPKWNSPVPAKPYYDRIARSPEHCRLCDEILPLYQEYGTRQRPSRGLIALWIVHYTLGLKEVTIAGMDNLVNGTNKNYGYGALKNEDSYTVPFFRHDFEKEQEWMELIPMKINVLNCVK